MVWYRVVRMFVIDVSKKYGDKISPCKLLVKSYRDEEGISRHRTILNLSKLPAEMANTIEQSAKGKKMVSFEEITQEDNRSLGEVTVLKRLSDRLGLTKILQDRLGKLAAGLTLSMAINRLSSPKAKYSMREWAETTCLPEILEVDLSDYHHNTLYGVLEILFENQSEIEEALWQETRMREEKENNGKGLTLMLYDITSTYLEGEQNELAEYGYNRDRKKGKKQINIALVTTPKGRPVSVEVLKGNITDKTTLTKKIKELKKRFDLKEIIYVFDRGMRDQQKLSLLRTKQIKYLTALTRGEINTLIEKGAPLQPSLFDEQDIAEYKIEGSDQRYIICKSDVATRSTRTREELLRKTEEKLKMVKRNVEKGNWKSIPVIASRSERWLQKWGMRKYFNLEIKEGYFQYRRKEETIERAQELDQLYVLETTDTTLSPREIQQGYKNLAIVESGFRTLKSFLEVRPVHHRKETTVKGHVFVCFLGLYLRKELEIQLQPLLKKKDYTFSYLLTQLREIRQSKLKAGEYETYLINKLNSLQKKILSVLRMRVLPLSPSP